MCRVDPQAGEPGPCIVRARGALGGRGSMRKTHRHAGGYRSLDCLILTILVGPSLGAKSQKLSAQRGNLFVWAVFDRAKFGAAGARCVPTMVGRAAKKILRSRQPFLIGKWPLLGAIPLVGAQRSSQAGPAAFPSTYTFRMEAQTQRTAQGSDQVQVDLYQSW